MIRVEAAAEASGGRLELKFVFREEDEAPLHALLDGSCRLVTHGSDPVSVVRSLYFDDAGLSACQANMAGLGRRQKLRLRWYDRRAPGAEAYFEVKWRRGKLTGKQRLRLRGQEALHTASPRELVERLLGALPAPQREALALAPEPTAVVEYRRRHFLTSDPAVRFTLDTDIVAYDLVGRSRLDLSLGTPLSGLVVVEGKAPVDRAGEIAHTLAPLSPRATRSSKYVEACRRLGLLAGVSRDSW